MSTLSQRSFASGELAPALQARVDMSKYASGLRTMRNYMILKSSGAATRAGTQFIARIISADANDFPRLVPFIYSKDVAFVLALHCNGVGYAARESYLTGRTSGSSGPKTITAITAANPPVVTTSANHNLTDGYMVYLSGVVGMTQVNGRFFVVNVLTATTFELLGVNGSAFTAYASGGTVKQFSTLNDIPTNFEDVTNPFELKYAQTGNLLLMVHQSGPPIRFIAIESNTAIGGVDMGVSSWASENATIFGSPVIAAPTGLATSSTAGATIYTYVVTSVDAITGEESLASAEEDTIASTAPATNAHTITWTPADGAGSYNVYQLVNGVAGYIGSTSTATFVNFGATPDLTQNPPSIMPIVSYDPLNPTDPVDAWPSAIGFFQQRLYLAATPDRPITAWASRPGLLHNFTRMSGLDDEAVEFTLVGKQTTKINHLLDLAKLIILSNGGEWACKGDGQGIITPSGVNPEIATQNGSSDVPPVVADNVALYIQDRGGVVRSLGFEFESDGYRGDDLTTFATHLFEGRTVVDAAYQKTPNSIVWLVMDDGALLGMTYVREQQILGWHRHDTDGLVKSIACIPEGNEDALYLSVAREIQDEANPSDPTAKMTAYFLERMNTRYVDDVVDYVGMDCASTYDGRKDPTVVNVTLSTSAFVADQVITVTASAASFSSTDLDNKIFLNFEDEDGEITVVRGTIVVYTSSTVVNIKVDRDSPGTWATTYGWSLAVDTFSQLWHLEGKQVSVFADGYVIANPNNSAYTFTATVTGGIITLPDCYAVVHIGLPFICDLETLDIDSVQAETLADKKMAINQVTLHVDKTRGLWVGSQAPENDDPLEDLTEMKVRADEDPNAPIALSNGKVPVNITSTWDSNGRIFIRQVDPIPATILAVCPSGLFPFPGQGS